MANKNTIAIELVVNDNGVMTIKKFGVESTKALGDVAEAGSKTSGVIDSLSKSYTELAVKGTAAWLAINKGIAMMDEAGKALQIESSFKLLSESSGVMADSLIGNLSRATKNTIEDSDLMQKAIKLMLLEYNPEQIQRFSNVVITSSQFAGKTAAEAYDELSDAIGNRQPKAMIRMGAVTKDQMKIVNEAINAGADSSALLELALANLELKQIMLKGTQDEATIALQQYHAQVKGTEEAVGKGLIIAVEKLYATFQVLAAGVLGISGNMGMLASVYARYREIVYQAMGDEEKAAKNRKFADDALTFSNTAWAARNDLMEKAGKNMYGVGEASAKATAQELADDKAKVDAQMRELASFIAGEEAKKKAAAELEKLEKEAQKNDIEGAELVAKLSLETIKRTEEQMKWFVEDEKDKQEALKKTGEAWRKAGDEAVSQMEREIAEGIRLTMGTIERLDKRREAEREVYKDLRGYEGQYFDSSNALLLSQYQKYLDLGVKKEAVDAWITAEAEKNLIKRAIAENDFMAGVDAGLITMQNNAMAFGKAGYEIFNTFVTSSKTALSDVLFQGFKAGTIDASQIWTTFTDSMLKKLTDTLSQMAVEAAAQPIEMMFKAAVSGDWTSVLGLLNKGWNLINSITGGDSSYNDSLATIPGDMRASGGPITGGSPVWVGEKGPELLFPGGPGYVMEHGQSMAYAARNGGSFRGFAEGGSLLDGYRQEAIAAGVYNQSLEDAAQAYMKTPAFLAAIGYEQPNTEGGALTFGGPEFGADNPYKFSSGYYNGPGDYISLWRNGAVSHYAYDDSPSLFETYFPLVVKAWLAYCTANVLGGLWGAGAAGGGAGEAATYGMGGSGLSGTAAIGAGSVGVGFGTSLAKGLLTNQGLAYLNKMLGGGTGDASLSFTGMNDNGLMASLSGMMGGIAPKDTSISIPMFGDGGSHRGGWRIVGDKGPELEYTGASSIVPLKGKDGSGSNRPIHVHFELDGKEVGLAIIGHAEVTDKIYVRMKKLEAWGH